MPVSVVAFYKFVTIEDAPALRERPRPCSRF